MKTLWLTRPRPDSEALAAQLDVPTVIAPVMQVMPIAIADMGERPGGLLLTSRHALLAPIPIEWRDVPAYCVGGATAEAARNCGFAHVIEGGGDALSLAAQVAEEVEPGTELLYLCGEETRVDLPALLGSKEIPVRAVIAYHTIPEDSVPAELIEAVKRDRLGGVVLYSPRGAALTADMVRSMKILSRVPELDAYCLSVAVAAEAGKLPWRSLKVANNPTTTAMVALIHASAIEEDA